MWVDWDWDWDWDWDGSPGGRRYRAPYGANNDKIKLSFTF